MVLFKKKLFIFQNIRLLKYKGFISCYEVSAINLNILKLIVNFNYIMMFELRIIYRALHPNLDLLCRSETNMLFIYLFIY